MHNHVFLFSLPNNLFCVDNTRRIYILIAGIARAEWVKVHFNSFPLNLSPLRPSAPASSSECKFSIHYLYTLFCFDTKTGTNLKAILKLRQTIRKILMIFTHNIFVRNFSIPKTFSFCCVWLHKVFMLLGSRQFSIQQSFNYFFRQINI